MKKWILLVISILLAHAPQLLAGNTPNAPELFSSEARPSGKLSFRLQALANVPALSAMNAQDQAAALSVAPEGPGSLAKDAQGKLLVYIRVADLSDAGLQNLQRAGAEVVHVSPEYMVVTAYVDASSLNALEGLQSVLSVQEALRPMNNSTCPNGINVSEGDTQLNAA